MPTTAGLSDYRVFGQPPEGKEEERKEDSASLQIPGYAFNTMTHNYPGLKDTLQRLGINEVSEVNAILRLSDYGRKGNNG